MDMDDVFGEIMSLGYGSDSIMLRLLRFAMDEAHENVQSKDGPIELLNARSKFYEMAMILVEGCLKLIEEKAEIPKTNRDKMLLDLKESKDMVGGRLEELKFSIDDKDIELVERFESECRLRQTLEAKDKELVALRAKLKLERTKSEEHLIYQTSGERERDEDFCDLKNSVDQQMLSIKQKLEDERMSLSSGNDLFRDDTFEDGAMNILRPEQNLVIEQMSSDIDCLKGTLDLAFCRMQNAELGPLEKQWRWKIEKDTILISINGFMSYLQEGFEVQSDQKRQREILMSEQWPVLINEITSLHHELKAFTNDDYDAQEKAIYVQENTEPSKNLGRTNSEPLPESDQADKFNLNQDSESSTYVAKMKKYHESIIRKQHEDLNWMKIKDIFRGKEGSYGKKSKGPDNIGKKIKEVISRLDNFAKWNAKIHDQKCVQELREVPKDEKDNPEIRKLKHESDDLNMQTMLIEETYIILLNGMIKDFYQEFHSYELASNIEDDIAICFISEMVNEWRILSEGKNLDQMFEIALKEDLYMLLIRDAMEEFEMQIYCYDFENLIQKEIHNFIIFEAMKSGNQFVPEAEAHGQSHSKILIRGEENLILKAVSPGKCGENQEELLLSDDLGLKNCDQEQLHYQLNCSIYVPLSEFQTSMCDLESLVHQKLEKHSQRLEELMRRTRDLFLTVGSLVKEESIYKKAFGIRCHNLKLAENEVDLLGDKVEELVCLLEKIYLLLDLDPNISSCQFPLSTTLNLIKKEYGRFRI